MTINSTTRKAGPFVGNGTVSAFPFGFKVFQASDLFVVRLNVSPGIEQTLVLNSDYSVTLNPDQNSNPGGVVTLLTGALASGYTLTLTSDVPDTQPTDLTNQGGFYPEVINDALDRATIQIQQLQEKMDRTLTAPISTPAGTDLTFPLPEANQFIGWNSTATGLQNLDGSSLASIVAFATAYADTFNGDGVASTFALSYPPATVRNLDVSINGVTQVPVIDYDINGQALNFTTPPPLGSVVLAKYWQALTNSSGAAQDFTLNPNGYTTAVDVQEGFDDLGSSAGTSKIGFLQTGTGAQARSAQDKLREYVSVKDFGAVGDGVTDDTAAFHAARDGAGAGQDIYVNPGVYIVDTCMLNVPNQNWVLAKGAEIRSVDGATKDAFVITANDVRISGSGTFYNGGLAAGTTKHCIMISGADNVVVEGVTVGGAKGPCIGIFNANNTTVRNVDFYDTWYAAVYAEATNQNMRGVTISGCTVTNTTSVGTNYRYGFNVHTDATATYSIDNVVISGNQFDYPVSSTQFPLLIEVYGGPTTAYKIDNVSVVGNTMARGGMGCSLSGVETATVTGNSIANPYLYGIELADTKHGIVSGNSIRGGQRGIAINNVSSGNISVSGNAVSATTSACIYLSQVTAFVSITGGSCAPSGGSAVQILSCKNWSVTGIVANGAAGGKKVILLDKSDQGTISSISAQDFTENAVLFYADNAAAYARVSVSNCTWQNVANSLVLVFQLSGGATVNRQFSYIGNFSNADTLIRRDYLDVSNNIIDFMGAGTPEGTYAGNVGSIYRRNNGGAGTTLYVKESGTGNTGWVGK